MPGNYFVEARRINKLSLKKFISEHPDQELKKTLAIFSLRTGLKTTTLESYIKELKDAGEIQVFTEGNE